MNRGPVSGTEDFVFNSCQQLVSRRIEAGLPGFYLFTRFIPFMMPLLIRPPYPLSGKALLQL